MRSFWNKLHAIGDILHLPEIPNWLLGLMVLVMILRVPSFFEPNYYGDEMIYLTLGQGVRQGVTLYKDLHDNKPPLLYLTAAAAGNIFWFKVILAFWSIVTIYYFFKLAEKLFKGRDKTVKLATLVFGLLTTLPLMEGNTVNAELFMILPSITALLILLSEGLNTKKIFFAGFLFGIAALFKIPALFELPVIVVYWLLTDTKNWKRVLLSSIVLALGFAAPIFLTIVWYFAQGAVPEYIKAAFLQNVGYLSSFRPDDIQKPFLVRNLPLLIRASIVFLGVLVLFIKRQKLSKNFILLTTWTLFTLFAITLSERPYPHYFVQTLAPFSFLIAMFFSEDRIDQVLVIFPITISLFVPVFYKFYFYPTTAYYSRFASFASGKITKAQYFTGFASTTNRNYKISEFIVQSSHPKDKIFMWDPDSAAIYAMSRRLPPTKFTVPYHVDDFSSKEEVAKQIIANPPKFIILTSQYPYTELNLLIRQRYLLIQQIDNASIYTRIDLAR